MDSVPTMEGGSRAGPRRRDIPLLAILLVAGVLRFGFGLAAMDGPVPETWVTAGDQFSYWYYGNEIAEGRGYLSYTTGRATSYYPIGYPATLGAVFWVQAHTPLPDHQPTAVALLHAAMATATVWFVYLIGRAALGRRLGLVAAAIVALFPNLIFNVPTYTLETAFIFWCTAALAVLLTHDWRAGPPSTRRLVAFGTVLGLSVLTRPFSLPFLAGLAIAVVVVGAGWRHALRAVGVALLPIVVLLTPWTIRNLDAMDAFVPISTNLGDTACIDRSLDADGGFRWAGHDGCADPDLPEAERNRENIRKALSFVLRHPVKEIELMGKRFGRMLEHDHSGLEEAESVNGTVLSPGVRRVAINMANWWFWLTMAASVAGLAGLLRRRAGPAAAIVITAYVSLLLLPVLLWGNVRFHIPVLPFAAVLAAAAPLAMRAPPPVVSTNPAPEGTPAG
ncbi:MAG TPA: glycosyltransferase family 39 protein [Acidimicrobiales bacterium]|nr:glycosyltransferase family 39 protein [Acidimicrobiales bacterium]